MVYNYLIKVSLLCEYGVGGSEDETISCKLEAAGHQAGTAHPKIHWISTDFDRKFVKTLSHLNIGWVSQILNKIWGNGADPKIQWILTDFDQILWKHFQPKIKKHCSSRIFYLIWQKSNFRWEFFPFLFLCLRLHLYLNHNGKSSGGWDGLSYFFPSFVGQNVESWYH